MNRVVQSPFILVIAYLVLACEGGVLPSGATPTNATTTISTAVAPETGPTSSIASTSATAPWTETPPVGEPPSSAGGLLDQHARRECDSFTIGLDRYVFNRLQPVLSAGDALLNSPPGVSDGRAVADHLQSAADQMEGLVTELDLMGVPPREIVDLVLSIREAVERFAAAFGKGARGWAATDTDLTREAQDDFQEAAQVLSSFFGWQLCG